MQGQKTRIDLYRDFVTYISDDSRRERKLVNRRMLSVFIWCFLVPIAVSGTLAILVQSGVLPRKMRTYADWVILIFPISYAVYFLGSEVMVEMPSVLKKGGLAGTLRQNLMDADWRERTCDALRRSVTILPEDWRWVAASFRMDLRNLRNRSRYLTALAGAVFFLIMQGIDMIGSAESPFRQTPEGFILWIANEFTGLTQYVGLAFFLLLLYLSSAQTHSFLERYLNCADLMYVGGNADQRRREDD